MIKKISGSLLKFSISLAALVFLTICLSLSAFADGVDPNPVVGCSQDGQAVDYLGIGTAIAWEGTTYIATDSLPSGEALYVYWDEEGNTYGMELCGNPFGNDDGLLWFLPSGSVDSVSAAQASLGVEYTLRFYDFEYYLENGDIMFEAYENCGDIYRAEQCSVGGDVLEGFFPWLIIDGDGHAVGYVAYLDTEEGVIDAYVFEEPAGGSTGDQNYNKIWYIVAGAVIAVLIVVILMKNKGQTSSDSSASQGQVIDLGGPPTIPVSDASAPSYEKPVHHDHSDWFIQIEGGVMNGYIYPIHNGTTIGRNPDCEIRYPADTHGISRRHCRFSIRDGGIYVTDLGSTSGTFIRGVGQLSPNVPKHIHQGDVLYLGEKKNVIVIRSNS